jgi:hypothetical protein
MFTRKRVLAAAAVIGTVAIAAPAASASAAPTPMARATVAASLTRFPGHGNWGNHGYGQGGSWNRGYGHGNSWNRGYGDGPSWNGSGYPGAHGSVGGNVFLPGASAGLNAGVTGGLPGLPGVGA